MQLDSLDDDALQFKYGAAWRKRNIIYMHTLIGEGGHGKVYRGTYDGQRAAFKVLNELRTLPSMLRYVRKSLLPEIAIQQFVLSQHERTRDNPHLLTLIDCQMFPSYTALLMLAAGALQPFAVSTLSMIAADPVNDSLMQSLAVSMTLSMTVFAPSRGPSDPSIIEHYTGPSGICGRFCQPY